MMKSVIGLLVAAVANGQANFATNMLFGNGVSLKSSKTYTITGKDSKTLENGQYPKKSDGSLIPLTCAGVPGAAVFKFESKTREINEVTVDPDTGFEVARDGNTITVSTTGLILGKLRGVVRVSVVNDVDFTFMVSSNVQAGVLELFHDVTSFLPVDSFDFPDAPNNALNTRMQFAVYNSALRCPAYFNGVSITSNDMDSESLETTSATSKSKRGFHLGNGAQSLFKNKQMEIQPSSSIVVAVSFDYRLPAGSTGSKFTGAVRVDGLADSLTVDAHACLGDCGSAVDDGCVDLANWVDKDDYGCDWFNGEFALANTVEAQAEKMTYLNTYSTCEWAVVGEFPATQACCLFSRNVPEADKAKRTQSDKCEEASMDCASNDINVWYDGWKTNYGGDTEYGCSYYTTKERCLEPESDSKLLSPDVNNVFGRNAKEACCSCQAFSY